MIETPDDLRHVIRELGTVDPDPGRVAELILEQLDDAGAHVVAGVTLRDYVRRILSVPNVPDSGSATPSFSMLDGRRTPSPKVQATQNMRIQAILNKSVYGLQGEWKHFGDCAEADLLFMVESRRTKADELVREAERYEKTLAALREHNVEKVRELPDAVILDIDPRHGH